MLYAAMIALEAIEGSEFVVAVTQICVLVLVFVCCCAIQADISIVAMPLLGIWCVRHAGDKTRLMEFWKLEKPAASVCRCVRQSRMIELVLRHQKER